MNKRLLLGIIACLVIPFLGAVVATDFTITRQLGDATNAFLIENFAGVDLFWIDPDGYAFSNGTLVITTASNAGGEHEVFAGKNGDDLQFRTIQAGNGTTITTIGTVIQINATGSGGGGEANTASNVGAGSGVFQAKNGVDLQFHSLLAGGNITITDLGDELQINATGGGGSLSDIHDIGNVTSVGCATDQILKVSGNTWGCAEDGGGSTVQYPYDYFIVTDGSTYTAYNGTYATVSTNADFDNVWTAIKADDDYLNDNNIYIKFGSGEFLTTNGIDIARSNVTLAGQGMGSTWIILDTDAPEQTGAIETGIRTLGDHDTIIDVAQDSISVTLDTFGNATDYIHNEWAYIRSDKQIASGSMANQAELQRINATAGTGDGATGIVTFYGRIFEDYNTISGVSPTIQTVTMLRDITLRDFTVSDLRPEGSLSTNTRAIENVLVENLLIDSVAVKGAHYTAISLDGVVHGKITNCYIQDMKVLAGLSYGIAIRAASNGVTIQGCNFEEHRYAIDVNVGGNYIQGSAINVLIDGNTILHPNYGCINTHEGSQGVIISNNQCIGRSEQQTLITTDTTLTDCWKMRSGGIVSNNSCKNVDNNGVNHFQVPDGDGNLQGHDPLIIEGNYFENIGQDGIYVENTTNAIISNNILVNVTSNAIQLLSSGNKFGNQDPYALVSNNIIRTSSLSTQALISDYRTDVIGNSFFDSGGNTAVIYLANASTAVDTSKSRIIDNLIDGYGTIGINGLRVQGGNFLTIDGNSFFDLGRPCITGQQYNNWDLSNSTITNNKCINSGTFSAIVGESTIGSYFANNYINNARGANCAFNLQDSTGNVIQNVYHGNVFSDVVCTFHAHAIAAGNDQLDSARMDD